MVTHRNERHQRDEKSINGNRNMNTMQFGYTAFTNNTDDIKVGGGCGGSNNSNNSNNNNNNDEGNVLSQLLEEETNNNSRIGAYYLRTIEILLNNLCFPDDCSIMEGDVNEEYEREFG